MIYVASSWRNPYYPDVVKRLKAEGFLVYDFRNLPHGGSGFHWTDVDENAPNWTFEEYEKGLSHPLAERQFAADLEALQQADTCVLVLPCGRSAHTEAGWMAGKGKRVIVYIPEMVEPELMYKLFDYVTGSLEELTSYIVLQEKRSASKLIPIDLGVSVLWADRNLGANDDLDVGEYYGWKEKGGRYVLTCVDGRKARRFDGWRLPTWDKSLELISDCKWVGKRVNHGFGWTAVGPSGDSVFFPFGGYFNNRFDDKVLARNYCGLYLTSEIR